MLKLLIPVLIIILSLNNKVMTETESAVTRIGQNLDVVREISPTKSPDINDLFKKNYEKDTNSIESSPHKTEAFNTKSEKIIESITKAAIDKSPTLLSCSDNPVLCITPTDKPQITPIPTLTPTITPIPLPKPTFYPCPPPPCSYVGESIDRMSFEYRCPLYPDTNLSYVCPEVE